MCVVVQTVQFLADHRTKSGIQLKQCYGQKVQKALQFPALNIGELFTQPPEGCDAQSAVRQKTRGQATGRGPHLRVCIIWRVGIRCYSTVGVTAQLGCLFQWCHATYLKFHSSL